MPKLFSCHYERYGKVSQRLTGKDYMYFFCPEEYLKRLYCLLNTASVKKRKLSCSFDLQIDKKVNNVKEDRRKKTDSNFDFSQVLHCLVLKKCYVVHYHRTLFTSKEAIKNENSRGVNSLIKKDKVAAKYLAT